RRHLCCLMGRGSGRSHRSLSPAPFGGGTFARRSHRGCRVSPTGFATARILALSYALADRARPPTLRYLFSSGCCPAMPTAPSSSPELIDLIRRSGVVGPETLATISDLALPAEPHKAAATLVAKGYITRFQAQQLLAGRHKGFRIGAYVVKDLLGRGGMGAVYLAEHTELHRKVAIKVLVPGKDEDQKLALERFLREARAAAALDHPNIVRIFDVSRTGEVPYLVMEYVEGETLQHVLDRGGASPQP